MLTGTKKKTERREKDAKIIGIVKNVKCYQGPGDTMSFSTTFTELKEKLEPDEKRKFYRSHASASRADAV